MFSINGGNFKMQRDLWGNEQPACFCARIIYKNSQLGLAFPKDKIKIRGVSSSPHTVHLCLGVRDIDYVASNEVV